MASKTREDRIIYTVACPKCGADVWIGNGLLSALSQRVPAIYELPIIRRYVHARVRGTCRIWLAQW